MPNGDPRDWFFYPTLTLMVYSYYIADLISEYLLNNGMASLIPALSHTFVEIDHEIISTTIHLPFDYSRMGCASYKRKYVHKYWLTTKSSFPRKKCG